MTPTEFSYILLMGLIIVIIISLIMPYNSKCSIREIFFEETQDLTKCISNLQEKNTIINGCQTDAQALQAKITTLQQDMSNNKEGWMKCKSDAQDLQSRFDKMNENYNTLQSKLNQVNQTSLGGLNQVTTSQESVTDCQSQMQTMSGNYITIQEQYNGLVHSFQELQKSYDALNKQYYVKCFKYNKNID